MSIVVPKIKYTDGWRYMTYEQVTYQLSERWEGVPSFEMHEGHLDGPMRTLTIYEDYPWDGATNAIDTKSSIVGSLVHDFFYEAFRQGRLDPAVWREKADMELCDICEASGMWDIRADAWFEATHLFAASAATPGSEREVLEAP